MTTIPRRDPTIRTTPPLSRARAVVPNSMIERMKDSVASSASRQRNAHAQVVRAQYASCPHPHCCWALRTRCRQPPFALSKHMAGVAEVATKTAKKQRRTRQPAADREWLASAKARRTTGQSASGSSRNRSLDLRRTIARVPRRYSPDAPACRGDAKRWRDGALVIKRLTKRKRKPGAAKGKIIFIIVLILF